MPSEFKAFLVTVILLLLLMWIILGAFEVAGTPISIAVFLVMFVLTYAWVKNEFFPSSNKNTKSREG